MCFGKEITFEKNGESSMILLEGCISEMILCHGSEEEKQAYSFFFLEDYRPK